MKTLYLSIIIMITCVLVMLSIQDAMAIPYFSPQDLYKQSDMVFYGQVVSSVPGPGPDSNYYLVKIVTSFKNPQKSDYITVVGNKTGTGIQYPQFGNGDNAIFYIQKINGINTISPYSQIAGKECDIHSFLGPAPIPGEPIMRGGYASRIYISDAYGNFPEKFPVNHHIVLSSNDIWNSYPEARTIIVEMSILDSNEQKIFYKKQGWGYRACDGPGTMQWDFVPTQSGKYTAILVVDNKTTASASFDVNSSNVDNAQLISSPLKQFKSGIVTNDVKCVQGFQLVIKAEDGSPACVKPETAQTLIMRGWGTFTVPSIDNTYDQKMNGTLSGNVVLAGGPRPGPQANYEIDVYATDGVTIVGKTLSGDNGNYSIQLSAGNYTIYALDYPTKQTHFVSVFSGKNTIFNIVYGTGYK